MPPPSPTANETARARAAGAASCRAGMERTNNPYFSDAVLNQAWNAGFTDQEESVRGEQVVRTTKRRGPR